MADPHGTSGGSLCPEAEERARLSDADFWDRVAWSPGPDGFFPEDDPPDPPALDDRRACPECGERGPCGYGAEGRPMIHVAVEEDGD